MRAVVQRVTSARVRVGGEVVAEIGPGLVVLLGVGRDDGPEAAEYLAAKVVDVRIFEDGEGKMNLSVRDAGGAVLVVSQFTLYGDCRKGRRPSFDAAAPPAIARQLYEDVARRIGERGVPVSMGRFQSHMQVELVNDGPVTVLLATERTF